MTERFHHSRNRGFTLIETLTVAAILIILLSLSAVGVAYYRDYLKITELDNAAREIYMAAENRAVLLSGGGQLDTALKNEATTLAGGGAASDSVYVDEEAAVSLDLLTGGAIDPTLLDGRFYIVYDKASGAVTDVFYAEGDNIQDIARAFDLAGQGRDARMRPGNNEPMLGYYGGQQAAREDYTPLPTPEVMVVVHNEDLLTVDVTFSVPESALKLIGNDWASTSGFNSHVKANVILNYQGEPVSLISNSIFNGDNKSRLTSTSLQGAPVTSVTYTWVLDALDAGGFKDKDFGFQKLFSDPSLSFGKDFTVTADIELSAAGRRPTSASGSDSGNSLFAEQSSSDTARLENLRHLQNLDSAISGVKGKTAAVQMADIDCHGKTAGAPYGKYEFIPIDNDELASFNGGWSVGADKKNRRNEITGLRVTDGSAADRGGAGLFAKSKNDMTFTGVRLPEAEVNVSGKPAGALVGSAGSGSKFEDIRVVNSTVVSVNGPVGGIAGKIEGASGKTNTLTDCQVYWEPEAGQDNLRSLLGSDQDSNPYRYEKTISGTHAGGLVGELSGNSGTTKIENSLAATLVNGTIAGGLIGDAQHVTNVTHSYADCYIKGITHAAGLIGQSQKGGTTAGCTLTDVYTAGFIDCKGMGSNSCIGGVCNVNGTISGTSVYSAVSYLNWDSSANYNYMRGVASNGSIGTKCYYLTHANDPATDESAILNSKKTFEDMSDKTFADTMGDAFEFKGYNDSTASKNTYPYNLQEKQDLSAYSFPGLKGLPHYGDWQAYFKEPSLVYYEQYSDNTIAFSGGNARGLIGKVSDTKRVKSDGYAVALMKSKPDEVKNSLTVTYKYLAKKGDQWTVEEKTQTYEGSQLLTASWQRQEGNAATTDYYWLAPLPEDLVIRGDTSEESQDIYRYLRFEIIGESGGGEYFYNPHFAETVKPYVPTQDGAQFIDWSTTSAPAAAAKVHEYISGTLIHRSSTLSVRTPRHILHLSRSRHYYHNTQFSSSLTFRQDLLLDGKLGIYTGYDNLKDITVANSHDDRSFQIQDPIGTQRDPFLGTYDGNRLAIRHLAFHINDDTRVCAGLFGSSSGTLKNIVYQLDPESPRSVPFYSNENTTYLGALVGLNTSSGKVENCAVEGVNLATRVYTSHVYIGGLAGANYGEISGSAAEVALMRVDSSNYGTAYVGGLVGYNRSNSSRVSTSYAVGRLFAEAPQENSAVSLAGFAGRNDGSISNSYCAMDLKVDGVNASAHGFCAVSGGGQFTECYYLNDGNFSYRGEDFLAKYEEGQGSKAQPISYINLTAENPPVPGMTSLRSTDPELVFPYPAVVSGAGGTVHYGKWPTPLKLGNMGVYYWEELQLPGKAPSYHVSLLAVDPGENQNSTKTITKISTLSTAHDQGGEVTRYGYGIFDKKISNSNILSAASLEETPFPLLYDEDSTGGKPFSQAEYASLEKSKANNPNNADHLVDAELEKLMTYSLGSGYRFHSFHTFGQDGGADGLYPNSTASAPNGTLTLHQGGNQEITVTFALNPLFADALAVEIPKDGSWSAAKEVPTFNSSKNVSTWTLSGDLPGGSENVPYGIRAIDQLQFIDWNRTTRNVDTRVAKISDANNSEHIQHFPYLSSGGNTGKYVWKQTYDILGEKANGQHKLYSPIAEYYDPSPESGGELRGWFGGTYDGGGYKIENVCIKTTNSSCAGLFGVVYNGNLRNIILYSSDGEGKITVDIDRTNSSSYDSKWFAMGTLAGVIGASDSEQYKIEGCSAAGYRIEATTYTCGGWGGSNIGGLVGETHMNLSGCSAVNTIRVHNADENDYMRVGGLVGSCLGSITDCYAGGSIEITRDTVRFRKSHKGVYAGGIVGGSYMKPLDVKDSLGNTIGTIGYKNGTQFVRDTSNTLTNCYSYVRLPKYEEPRSEDGNYFAIKGLFAVGGAGELEPFDVILAGASGKSTLKNCYYLASETLANNTVEAIHGAKYTRQMTYNGQQSPGDTTKVKIKTDLPYEPGTVYDFFDFSNSNTDWQGDGTHDFPLERIDGYTWTGTITESGQITATNNGQVDTYYLKGYGDGSKTGALIFTAENKNEGTYRFRGWLVSNNSNALTVATDPTDPAITNGASTVNGITSLTYEELANMTNVQEKNADIYTLLNAGEDKVFYPVTTKTEDGIAVPGKYSYSTKLHPELRDRDYPFPTVLTKDGGKYHVHYGDWPLKGFRRQTLFDGAGQFELLGGSPIEVDFFLGAQHQEYLVLTDGVKLGGTWKCDWESIRKAEETGQDGTAVKLVADCVVSNLLNPNEIENFPTGESGKSYYRLSLTPKKSGTDILHISYTDTDTNLTYTLDVTVHVTAGVELRPNRVFLFPDDTAAVNLRAADSAGQPLTHEDGSLSLDVLTSADESLTARDVTPEDSGGKFLRIQLTTAGAQKDDRLRANVNFTYNIPNPESPEEPDRYPGGSGGDIQVDVIQPWTAKFTETKADDGTKKTVCEIVFPGRYEVKDGENILDTLMFQDLKATLAFMENPPALSTATRDGNTVFTLDYGAAEPQPVTLNITLTMASEKQLLVPEEEVHTLTLTVEKPAEPEPEPPGTESLDALPPAEDGQENAPRRRRWKRVYRRRRRALERRS